MGTTTGFKGTVRRNGERRISVGRGEARFKFMGLETRVVAGFLPLKSRPGEGAGAADGSPAGDAGAAPVVNTL